MSQTSISVPPPLRPTNRWSVQSEQTMSDFAPSSVPSSPLSMYRNSAIFDLGSIDHALESSRPTSPGSSIDPLSPDLLPRSRKRMSEQSNRSFTVPAAFQPSNVIHEEEDCDVEDVPDLHLTPPEEATGVEESEESLPSVDSLEQTSADDVFSPIKFQPTLRRSASHESVLSISGVDIHTLKSRPSQLTITGSGAIFNHSPRLRSSAHSFISTEPVISSTMAIARPTLSRKHLDSTTYLRSSMGIPDRPLSRSSNSSNEGQGTVRKVGGWVWSRWGVSPTPTPTGVAPAATASSTVADMTPPEVPKVIPTAAVNAPVLDPMRAMMGRPSGVNQKGPIPGLRPPQRTPSKVNPAVVDQDALREVLME